MSALWNRVMKRVDDEQDLLMAIRQSKPKSIQDFYPELRTAAGAPGSWASTGYLPVLACVMTAPHTVVDLFDWDCEDELIAAHGVDERFLCELRDQGHVTLLVNVPPERFERESCEWMYPLLADERTLWRVLRTPAYFDSRCEHLDVIRGAMEVRLRSLFRRLPDDRLTHLCKAFDIPLTSTRIDALSRMLSVWHSYVYVYSRDAADEAWKDFCGAPESCVLSIRQLYFEYAPRDTVGLGGTVRMTEDQLHSYFPHGVPWEIPESLREIRAVHDYLTTVEFGHHPADLSAAQYWHMMSHQTKKQILSTVRTED